MPIKRLEIQSSRCITSNLLGLSQKNQLLCQKSKIKFSKFLRVDKIFSEG